VAFVKRFRGRSSPSRKRLVVWDSGPNMVRQPITGIGKIVWTNGSILVKESEVTITRVRGQVSMSLDLATAAGDGFNGAIGLGIVSSDAFTVGQSAMPGPFSDPEWPGWFWHRYWSLRGVAAQTAGENIARNAVSGEDRFEIDSKAMRKQGDNETLFGMIETAVETGTAGMDVLADTRVLDKLS